MCQLSSLHHTFFIQKEVKWLANVIHVLCAKTLFAYKLFPSWFFTSPSSNLLEEIILWSRKEAETECTSGLTMEKGRKPAGPTTVGSGRWPDLKGICQMVHLRRQDPPPIRNTEQEFLSSHIPNRQKNHGPSRDQGDGDSEHFSRNYGGQRLEKIPPKTWYIWVLWESQDFSLHLGRDNCVITEKECFLTLLNRK